MPFPFLWNLAPRFQPLSHNTTASVQSNLSSFSPIHDRINLTIDKGEKKITAHANQQVESVNIFIKHTNKQTIERDGTTEDTSNNEE